MWYSNVLLSYDTLTSQNHSEYAQSIVKMMKESSHEVNIREFYDTNALTCTIVIRIHIPYKYIMLQNNHNVRKS